MLQMQKNRADDASTALLWLRGRRYDPSIELSELQMDIEKQKESTKSVAASMLRSSSVKALCISFGLFICQQLCGINVVIFYTTELFEVSEENSLNMFPVQRNAICIYFSERQYKLQCRFSNSPGRHRSSRRYIFVGCNCRSIGETHFVANITVCRHYLHIRDGLLFLCETVRQCGSFKLVASFVFMLIHNRLFSWTRTGAMGNVVVNILVLYGDSNSVINKHIVDWSDPRESSNITKITLMVDFIVLGDVGRIIRSRH